jgi:hypothetical protein
MCPASGSLTLTFTWLVGQERYHPVASVMAIVNSSW